jgi:hypothetical protein
MEQRIFQANQAYVPATAVGALFTKSNRVLEKL